MHRIFSQLKRRFHKFIAKSKAGKAFAIGRVLTGCIAGFMAISAMGTVLISIEPTAAAPENEYLFNIPYTHIPPRTPADLDWTKTVDHVGYDTRAYTETVSAGWNGTATPNHAVINDESITFFGYPVDPYFDYIFTDAHPTLTGINITMRPMQMIFHTFYQTGFLFNGIMEQTVEAGVRKAYYTGYAIVLECSNAEGMLESGDATLKLVYIDHEEWDVDGANSSLKKDQTKSPLRTRTLIATLKSGIQNRTTPVFRLTLDIDQNTRAFRLYIDGALRAQVAASDVKSGADSVGLGFFTSYYYHNCEILTVVRYDEINLEFAPADPPKSTATLRFMLDSGSTVIHEPETEAGYTDLQYYRIEQPAELEYLGETYYLVGNSRDLPPNQDSPLNLDIVEPYASTVVNPNANTTILYYSKDPPNQLGNKPRKFGSVNGEEWKTGSPELPVPVDANYDLEYNALSGPKAMTQDESDTIPVLAQGNTGATTNTTWMKQPQTAPLIAKNNVITVNTVNLAQNYPTLTDFENDISEWRGENIVKAWDATYSPNDPINNNFQMVTQYAQTIPYGTCDNTSIIPYLDSMNVPGMGITGPVTNHPYTSSADYLAIYRISLKAGAVPDTIYWAGRADSSNNIALLYTGGTWEPLGIVTTASGYTWTLTPQQKAGITGNCVHIAFFSAKTGAYAGIYNIGADVDPFTLTYPAGSAPTLPEPAERVYIWLTERPESTPASRRYNMYIGGAGGVQLSPNAAYQFGNFGAMTAINFSRMHTDNTLSMAGMFTNCASLTKLDVSWFYTENVQDMSGMFYNCYGMTSVEVKYFNTKNVTGMSTMFYNCGGLASLELLGWNTAKVTDMSQMFYGCSSLTKLDLRSFNTALVTSMNSMFYNCSYLTSLDISTFDTANVTNMHSMFYNCYRLPSLTVTHFDTVKVTQMAFMFARCNALTTLDLSSFDTSNPGLTSMESMFQSCAYLTSINLTSFKTHNIRIFTNMFSGCSRLTSLDVTTFNTASAVNMYGMFQSCSTLQSLDVSTFDTSSVINMNYMFASCSNLRSAGFNVLNFNTSACKTMFGMFSSCSWLTELDLRSFNTVNVTGVATSPNASLTDNFGGMAQMFYSCSRLETLHLSSFDTSNVGTMSYMFGYCSALNLTLDLRGFNVSNVKNMSYMFYAASNLNPAKLLLGSWNTSGVTDMSAMFGNCTGFTGNDFDAFLAHFNTSSVINMSSMFANCTGITSISLPGFNTSNVTGMTGLFSGCASLVSVDLRSFDTTKVNSFANMFNNCSSLTAAGVSASLKCFNTASSGSFSSMFNNCAALTSLDLRNFSTGNASSFNSMFQNCANLASVNLASFNTANATTFASMFQNCPALTVLDLRNFNTEKVYNFTSMFQGCTTLATLHLTSFHTVSAYANGITMNSMFQDCPALTSLNLSTFTTNRVNTFASMFSGCTGLTSLSLSNFDTPMATSFYRMFYNCSSLTAINGISHFNTEKVTDMREMFYGCKALTSLDIRWWETPALRYVGGMFNMADPANSLTTIHLESLDLLIDPVNPPYTYSIGQMFANIRPGGTAIYVGSIDMMTWFDNAEPKIGQSDMDLVNRIRVNPWPVGANPGPAAPTPAVVLPVEYQPPSGGTTPNPGAPSAPTTPQTPSGPGISPITPPAPPDVQNPDPNPKIFVTDIIPDGLQIISASGGLSTWFDSGNPRKIWWEVESLTFDLSVMTKVTPQPEDGKEYDNFATVHFALGKNSPHIGTDENTNTTYHIYGLYYLVTEQYYYIDSSGVITRIASNNAFNNGYPVTVRAGRNFNLSQAHIPQEIYGLTYYAYQSIDPSGSMHTGLPSDPIYANVQEDRMIRYYYRSYPIAVYVHFVDSAGNELLPTVAWAAAKDSSYYMPVRYLDSFTADSVLWNYYGYKLSEPSVNPHKARGLAPDYTILTNDGSPQFANIQEDKHITLYFDTAPTVTVNFLDDYKPSSMIQGSLTWFVTNGSIFDPDSITPSLFDDILSAGNLYEYTGSWSRDVGARQTTPDRPAPFTVTANTVINLYFKTYYNILEKFHTDLEPRFDGSGHRLPPAELSPDVFQERIPAGTPYTGEPPTVLVDGDGDIWSYAGYKLFDDSNPIYSGVPEVEGLDEHLVIIFVYEKTPSAPAIQKLSSVPMESPLIPGEEFTYTISVKNLSSASVTVSDLLPAGLEFVSSNPTASTADESGRTRINATVPLSGGVGQLVITVRVVAEDAVFRNYANVTNTSNSKVYRTNTVVNHSGGALDSITIQKSADPASGTEDAPKMVGMDSEITYTITVSNANEGRRIPAVVTDVLPYGMVYLGSDDAPPPSYSDSSRTVTWNVTSLPSGDSAYTFTVRAENAATVYENTAFLKLPGLDAIKTNSTWHAVAAPTPPALDTPVKKAFWNGSEAFDNGSREEPVVVKKGETIRYTISFTKPSLITVANPVFKPEATPPEGDNSCIKLTKSNNAPVVELGGVTAPRVDAGKTVKYEIIAENTGESDASNVVLRDILPAGTSLVANSVKINNAATSNYSYNANTRMVKVNVGAGATGAQGGLVKGDGSFSDDCDNIYTVTFEALVDGRVIAQNRKYENQGKATYQDRYDEENTIYTDYSNVSEFLPGKGIRDIVTDPVPQGLTVNTASVTASGGAYNATTHTVTWDLYTKPVGPITLEFEVTVTDAPENEDGIYKNIAYAGTDPTNPTWHELLKEYILHIRQLVLSPLTGLQRPTMGYYTLLNDDSILPLTSDSLSPGFPFTDYTLLPGDDPVYVLTDIVPQYYKFVGHGQNPGEDPDPAYHSLTAAYDTVTANGGIELDYNDAGEIWITVYITPEGKPGHNQATVETNRFGDVYKVYYNVTYFPGYGGTGGSIDMDILRGSTYTIKSAVIANVNKPWSSFASWNTQIDGSGTKYMPGQEIKLSANLELYAQWLVVAT